jgi:hypothetical protein
VWVSMKWRTSCERSWNQGRNDRRGRVYIGSLDELQPASLAQKFQENRAELGLPNQNADYKMRRTH